MKPLRSVCGIVAVAVVAGALAVSAGADDGRGHSVVPSSIAALGNSLSRGYGSAGIAADNPAASWSTGDNPAVGSHYLRLLALNPTIADHAYNFARSGSTMSATTAQAAQAIAVGAQYVTIESGTNDVCTSTVAQMTSVSDFTNALGATLTQLTSSLPPVRILVTTIPDWPAVWNNFRTNPVAVATWQTLGRCPALLGASATDADRRAVAQRINELNRAIAKTCRAFTGCISDGRATFKLFQRLGPADFAFDFHHLSIQGQAKLAAATWNALRDGDDEDDDGGDDEGDDEGDEGDDEGDDEDDD